MKPKHCLTMFKRLQAENPTPQSDLQFSNPFELLIAVILSAQATDISVNKATKKLFAEANTPKSLFALGEEGLKPFIQSIGLYHNKAKYIIQTCQMLIEKHHSIVPQSREDLEMLPGVGRKTANVVLNVAFKQPTMAVDTHVFRVANRTGLAPGKTPLAVEKALLKSIPKPFLQHGHHWLILLGRYTCKAKNPQCSQCLIADLCQYTEKQKQG